MFGHPHAPAPLPAVPADPPPVISWIHHLPFPGSDGATSIAFAPDSRSVYINIHTPTVDIWERLVWFWPELFGAALVLLTITCLLLGLRTARRPQRRGHPYCPRCNYEVTAQLAPGATPGGPVCPECGCDLRRRRPRPGRSLPGRLAPLMALWLLATGAYVSLWLAGVSRLNAATAWFSWPMGAASWTQQNALFSALTGTPRQGDLITQVDLATGKTMRTVLRRTARNFTRLAISPDGDSLFIQAAHRADLARISARTGRTLATVALPGRLAYGPDIDSVIGFSPDGRTAYIQWFDDNKAEGGVTAWNYDTGESRILARTPGYRQVVRGREISYGRLFLPWPGGTSPRFISWPNYLEAFNTQTFVIRFHESPAAPPRELQPSPVPSAMATPALTPDGKAMFIHGGQGQTLLRVDLETGASPERLPLGLGGGNGVDLSKDGSLLACQADGAILVRDIAAELWVARLEHPASVYSPMPRISPDGRWVVAVCQKSLSPTGAAIRPGRLASAFTHDIVVWDLGPATGSGGTRPPDPYPPVP